MGHAVYTKADPRAIICKKFAEKLAVGTESEAEFNLLKSIERLAPEVILQEKGTRKDMCANIDMYSGFVYSLSLIHIYNGMPPWPAWPSLPAHVPPNSWRS